MKLGIMQPYLFPYIGYFQIINAVDKYILFDDVNYIKKGWINRNRILLNGKEFLFTIPLETTSQNKLICDMNLFNENKWKSKFLKTVDTAYKRAPFFNKVYPLIEQIIKFDELKLAPFISNSIIQICSYLKIDTPIISSSIHYNTAHLKGQDKILEICRIEKCNVYINPVGGIGIYQRETFEKQDIRLLFLKSKPLIYNQIIKEFIPSLSVIDVIMFNGTDKCAQYLNEFELI
jgi:hypothetical protein